MFDERTRYTLKLMAYLGATAGDGYETIDSLSDELMIPRGYLGKICQELSTAGFIQSKKGAHGGVQLNGDPEEVKVIDILDHLNALSHNTEHLPEKCCVPDLFNECMVDLWMKEFEDKTLGEQSLAELVNTLQTG